MNEAPLFPLWVTVALTIWAPVGPLAGILIGHFLVRSWERKRWLADSRKEEFRRVLAAFNKLNGLMIQLHTLGGINPQLLKEAIDESSMALNTSLFISDFLETSNVAKDIVEAVTKFNNGGSFDDYRNEYWKLIDLILKSARKSAL